jgi:hypothetical protein
MATQSGKKRFLGYPYRAAEAGRKRAVTRAGNRR